MAWSMGILAYRLGFSFVSLSWRGKPSASGLGSNGLSSIARHSSMLDNMLSIIADKDGLEMCGISSRVVDLWFCPPSNPWVSNISKDGASDSVVGRPLATEGLAKNEGLSSSSIPYLHFNRLRCFACLLELYKALKLSRKLYWQRGRTVCMESKRTDESFRAHSSTIRNQRHTWATVTRTEAFSAVNNLPDIASSFTKPPYKLLLSQISRITFEIIQLFWLLSAAFE